MSKPLDRLLRIMARLRSPRGCPWDREQTHRSMIRCLRDEAKEVIHAIESGDPHALREELGDLLLQVVFHAQLAREKGRFGFNDVVVTLTRKLVRRHPHVFGNARARDAKAVLRQWHEIKAREKRDRRHARNRPRRPAARPRRA
jgi:tetrapyrrole methylase family protein/MazG family protein